jgi:hypothetical protein
MRRKIDPAQVCLPLGEPNGLELRDRGMQQAIETAEKTCHLPWGEQAYEVLLKWLFLKRDTHFKCEDFREHCQLNNLLPEPPSLRAYGAVFMRAARNRVIFRVGHTQVTNPRAHRANCTLWSC